MTVSLAPLILGQVVNFAFTLCLYMFECSVALVLVLSGSASVLLYAKYLMSWFRSGESLVSPGFIYLLSSLFRIGVGIIYAGMALPIAKSTPERASIFSIGAELPLDYMVEGLLILLIGEIGFAIGLSILKHARPSVPMPCDVYRLWKVGLVGVIASLTLFMLARSGVHIGALGRLGPLVLDYAAPAGIFMMLQAGTIISRGKWTHPIVLIPLGLLVGLAAVSMTSYMKKSVVVAILPLILFLLCNPRLIMPRSKAVKFVSFPYIACGTLAVALFVSFISVYAELRRPDFYEGAAGDVTLRREKPPVLPYIRDALLASIPGTEEFSKSHRFPDKGIWYFWRRVSHADEAGWSYKRVASNGWRGDDILHDFLITITPRIFWPNKPQIYWGRELAVVVGAATVAEQATTSFGLPMAAAYYWIGGWGYVLVGMTFSGLMLTFTWRLFGPHFGRDLPATTIGMAVIVISLSWFEGEFFGGMEHFIYFLLIYPLVRMTAPLMLSTVRPQFTAAQR